MCKNHPTQITWESETRPNLRLKRQSDIWTEPTFISPKTAPHLALSKDVETWECGVSTIDMRAKMTPTKPEHLFMKCMIWVTAEDSIPHFDLITTVSGS